MNETLAQLLSERVAAALPFLADPASRAVGLARLYTTTAANGDGTVPVKLPVPVTFTAEDCARDERYLVPDDSTPAILFLQDNGSQPFTNAQTQPSAGVRTASLTLLLWVNTRLLDGDLSEMALLEAVLTALSPGQRFNLPPFADVLLSYQVLPAEASLYGRYSFVDTPLLLPPARLLGLGLTVQFRVDKTCLPPVLPGVAASPVVC